jgi:hypothetical protein
MPYDPGGVPQLYRIPPEGGDPIPFGPPGYTLVHWTPDEILLAGRQASGEVTLYLADAGGENLRQLLPEAMTGDEGFWSDRGQGWIVSASEMAGGPRYLWLGKPWHEGSGMVWQRLTSQEGWEETHPSDIAGADAALYLARIPGAETGDLMVVPLDGHQPPTRLVSNVLSYGITAMGYVEE